MESEPKFPRFKDVDAKMELQDDLLELNRLEAAYISTLEMLKALDRMKVVNPEERKRYQDRLDEIVAKQKPLKEKLVKKMN